MLQSIREHTQGWIAGAIISIIILTFALWGIHSYFVGNGAERTVATVNGVDITTEQLSVAYERLRRQVQAQQGSAVLNNDEAIKHKALKLLLEMEVLKQASSTQGFLVSNQQVDGYLQAMPEFQVDGQFSVERFHEVLSSTVMTASDFLDVIRTSLLIDQPRLGVLLTSFSLPDEAKATLALVNQEREIAYINIPKNALSSSAVARDDAKIKSYYDAHRNEFMTQEQVSVDYIMLSAKDLYASFHPDDAALKGYYNENMNSYTRPAAWKLAAIMIPVPATATESDMKSAESKAKDLVTTLNNKGDFNSISKNHTNVAIANGELVDLSKIPVEYQKAVLSLKNTSDVSDPVKTKDGFVILKAVAMNPSQVADYSAVQDKVKAGYLNQHAEDKLTEMREKLADLTYEHPDSLQAAADALGVKVQTSETFTKAKAGNGISQYKPVRDAAFSNDVLQLQNNSDVIQINPETIAVVRVKTHTPSALLALDKVSDQISEKLKSQAAEKQAEAIAKDLTAKLQSGTALSAADLNAKGLKWVATGYLGRYSTKVDTAILDLAFRLPNPVTAKTNVTYGVTRIPNGFAIVALKSVKDGATDSKQLDVFAEQVQNSEGMLEYDLYKKSQMHNAKIKHYS